MLVYGDPSFRLSRRTLLDRLPACAGSADLADLRFALILTGQWEQGIADAGVESGPWERVTDQAAEAFIHAWLGRGGRRPQPIADRPKGPEEVEVRVPEGYAFYALYPEQYARAALDWARGRPASEKVLVAGIRTIGTSLSAIVRASLSKAGLQATRLTVRPFGPPFERVAELPPGCAAGATRALVVDEGPGLSGSSMTAVVEALVRAGMPEARITLLPAHAGLPGRFGSTAAARLWERLPRVAAGAQEPVWDDMRLSESLAEATSVLAGGEPVWKVEDPGREPFGRPRLLVTLADGSSWVWKYYGTAAIDAGGEPSVLKAYESLSRGSYSTRPEDPWHGWLPFQWVSGSSLTSRDRSIILTGMLGRHTRERAAPPLGLTEHRQAVERLREMLRVNLAEGLDAAAADRLLAVSGEAEVPGGSPTAGDYRMGPEHWIRTEHDILVKVGGGLAVDHTLVGSQPFLWDVAGASVEWELSPGEEQDVIAAVGLPVPSAALRFYRVAYAAFRMGQSIMAAASAEDQASRYEADADRYRRFLERLAAQEV